MFFMKIFSNTIKMAQYILEEVGEDYNISWNISWTVKILKVYYMDILYNSCLC